jgi:hypothetical protein
VSRAIPSAVPSLAAFARLAATLLLLAAAAPRTRAQARNAPREPSVGFVYPAGACRGSTVTVIVGGQTLVNARGAVFSGSGIQGRVLEHTRPLTQKELTDVREQIDALVEKRRQTQAGKEGAAPWTPADDAALAALRKKAENRVNPLASPALSESLKLEVTLAPDLAPGPRELRIWTPAGLSNPIAFHVGQLPEVADPPGKTPSPRQLGELKAVAPRAPVEIALPAVANGQILPGEGDRYRFRGTEGHRLVVIAWARALNPYLADAVPGWFQATLTLRDASGRELAYVDDDRFNPDPVLEFTLPADGIYEVEIRDAIHRGREDFVYRLALGDLPYVRAVYPLGGPIGEKTTAMLYGSNLGSARATIDGAGRRPGPAALALQRPGVASNPVGWCFGDGAETTESDNPHDAAHPQRLALPIVVNGRIGRSGECDAFVFAGKAGETIVAEVLARRLGSPLDSALQLADRTGRQIAFNDDTPDPASGLQTHHADARLSAVLPEDGDYVLRLTDAQAAGGETHAYRLRIGPERPDFELRVVPSSITVRGGGSVPLAVHVLRRDGFAGEISFGLREGPLAFRVDGGRIPAGVDRVQVTLTVPPVREDALVSVAFEGRATIDGREVRRSATPADDRMQAFLYRHLVPAATCLVNVAGRAAWNLAPRVPEKPVVLTPGGRTRVHLAMGVGRPGAARLSVQLHEPPAGITVDEEKTTGDGIDVWIRCAADAKPGLSGNLVFAALVQRGGAQQGKAKGPAGPQPAGYLPAVPFQVTGSAMAATTR